MASTTSGGAGFAGRSNRLVWRLWPLAAAVLVVACVGAGTVATEPGRDAFTSAMFLPDMLFSLPVRPVTWLSDTPIHEHVTIRYGEGASIPADIYRPGGGTNHGAVVFSMGAPPLEPDDRRLQKLAEDAARAGLVMVIPFSPRLEREDIEQEEVDALVAAFRYMEEQSYVAADRTGFIGVSVGSSLALLAAADARIRDDVDFVVAFGGYYDALDTFIAIATHRIWYGAKAEDWEPDPHSERVMARQIVARLDRESDRDLLWRQFVRQNEPLTPSEIASLTGEGKAAYDFLTAPNPEAARAALDRLPASLVDELRALSPSSVADRLNTELFIVHDRSDAFIPYVESRRLRDQLAGRPDLHYDEVSLFEHVEPRLGRQAPGVVLLDATRLYYRLYQLLLRIG